MKSEKTVVGPVVGPEGETGGSGGKELHTLHVTYI